MLIIIWTLNFYLRRKIRKCRCFSERVRCKLKCPLLLYTVLFDETLIRSSQRIFISRAQISKARLRSVNKTRWRRQGKDRGTTSIVVCHFVQGMADLIQSFPFTDYLKHRKIGKHGYKPSEGILALFLP